MLIRFAMRVIVLQSETLMVDARKLRYDDPVKTARPCLRIEGSPSSNALCDFLLDSGNCFLG